MALAPMSGTGNTQTIPTDQTGQTTNVDDAVGAGNTSQTGGNVSPDVQVRVYAQITISLGKFSPALSGDKLDIFLAQITAEIKDKIEESEKSKATIEMEKKQSASAEKRAKLDEAEEKMEKAEKKSKKAGFWGKLRNAFQIIGSVLSIAIGTLLVATGVGAAIGGLMIASGVVGLIMSIDQAIAEKTGSGMMGNLAKAFGASDEEAAKWDMGFQITMAVVGIALGIASLATGNPTGLTNSMIILMKGAALATGKDARR